MRKFVYFLLLLIVLPYGAVIAAEKPTIAYVDLRKVLMESKIGKKNKAELEKLIKEEKNAVISVENKLKAMQQAFQKEQLLMTDDQKKAKQKNFQEQAEAYQKMVNEAKQTIADKDKEFASKSIVEIRKIIASVAKEMNLSLVLEASESGLLYAEGAMDLTQKVIERYDAKAK